MKLPVNNKYITPNIIERMSYIELMALLNETNRPPGGKNSTRELIHNCFITSQSKVLDIGCNTGYVTFEIARVVKCSIDGIDSSKNMIKAAKAQQKINQGDGKTIFYLANATNLPFQNQSYDVVVCGGSMAFIDKKLLALKEIKRVLKDWGFFGDINFFYKSSPPLSLLKKLNKVLNITILPWDLSYWINLYRKSGFEIFQIIEGNLNQVSKDEVIDYCSTLVAGLNLPKTSKKMIINRLLPIMKLFNSNHRFLRYGIFILRKRPIKEQASLFGV